MSGRIWALTSLYFLPSLDPISLKILFIIMICMIIVSSKYFATVEITEKPHHKNLIKKEAR
jgi:hypothetical protein